MGRWNYNFRQLPFKLPSSSHPTSRHLFPSFFALISARPFMRKKVELAAQVEL